jgi:hypothetical protein
MSMAWAIPSVTMRETYRQRQKRDKREESRERKNKFKCCPDCNGVFKKADFTSRQFRKSLSEEFYEPGDMPTIHLERKQCLSCKEKSATTI